MAILNTFKDLIVWQKAHEMVIAVYKITNEYPKHELFSLTSQTRRAAVSVPANIVEGFRRQGLRDRINFYNIADSSLEELKYRLILAKDLLYINEINYSLVMQKCEETGRLLTRWIQSQKSFLN